MRSCERYRVVTLSVYTANCTTGSSCYEIWFQFEAGPKSEPTIHTSCLVRLVMSGKLWETKLDIKQHWTWFLENCFLIEGWSWRATLEEYALHQHRSWDWCASFLFVFGWGFWTFLWIGGCYYILGFSLLFWLDHSVVMIFILGLNSPSVKILFLPRFEPWKY